MTERTKQEQTVVTNLVDAGCDDELIEQLMDLLKTDRRDAGLSLLAKTAAFCWTATTRTRKESIVWTV